MSSKPIWREMTEAEQSMAKALGRCRFGVGTWQKRFARHIYHQALMTKPTISEKQAPLLRKLVYSWRRQIPEEIVSLAGDVR